MQDLCATSVQQFIRNFKGDPLDLALKGSPIAGVEVRDLVEQIIGRRQIRKKLPLWFQTEGIVYPPKLNLEQTSSQATAQYKASLCAGSAGADLTGGWGVDAYYMAQSFTHFDYFEQNQELGMLAKHNLRLLGGDNINFKLGDGLKGIEHRSYDWIYIDPSRRHQEKGKVIGLQDYTPDLTQHLNYLLERTNRVLIKTAPMLDLNAGLRGLHSVKEIQVVAVGNEVKELLWLVEAGWKEPPQVKAIVIKPDGIEETHGPLIPAEKPPCSPPLAYIYEPSAALIKAHLHDLEAIRKGLYKLAPMSHYYTSDSRLDYPGRTYRVDTVWPYKRSVMKEQIQGQKAWVGSRNFGESVAELRKRWKLTDAEGIQLIFTQLENGEKVVLKVDRLS